MSLTAAMGRPAWHGPRRAAGVATVTVPAGTAAGSYQATAAKASYTSANFTVKVS